MAKSSWKLQGDAVEIVVNQTPFYAESGGQAGDAGVIRSESGLEIVISDVKKRAARCMAISVSSRKASCAKATPCVSRSM
ncbi:MAG: alanine--tRNA ligase-related protein [Parvularculaceae bacterium]